MWFADLDEAALMAALEFSRHTAFIFDRSGGYSPVEDAVLRKTNIVENAVHLARRLFKFPLHKIKNHIGFKGKRNIIMRDLTAFFPD